MNEPRDFREIEWGTSYESLNGMIIYDQGMDGKLKYCTRANDEKKMGNAISEGLVYSFFDNRFYEVQVVLRSWTNNQILLEYLVPILGNTYNFYETKNHKMYLWDGNDIVVCCVYNKPSDATGLIYTFKQIESEIKESGSAPLEEMIKRRDIVMLEYFEDKTDHKINDML